MKRILSAIAAFAVALAASGAVASPVAAVSGATCVYDGPTHQIQVTLVGDVGPYLGRDVAGHITMNGQWCDNAATVTNTDHITVTGDAESQSVQIDLANKGFKPGYTNEPGKTDEIEFTINLRGGNMDQVVINGSEQADKVDLGEIYNNHFGLLRQINLNAGETRGIDSDVTMLNVERVNINVHGGNDRVRGRGKAGTGGHPITLPLYVYGGPGNDIIKGGDAADQLHGDEGLDKIWGFGTGDSIFMNDGQGGDIGYGGGGVDHAIYDPGDSWTE